MTALLLLAAAASASLEAELLVIAWLVALIVVGRRTLTAFLYWHRRRRLQHELDALMTQMLAEAHRAVWGDQPTEEVIAHIGPKRLVRTRRKP